MASQDSHDDHIYHSELFTLTKRGAAGDPQKISFTVPIFEPHHPQYYIHVVSDSRLQAKNTFELGSFFRFWWQFGNSSCFIKNHTLVYIRLILGFMGQFLCSYNTLPLYALVTQMGTNYKAALIPQRIRDTIHGWGKESRRRRRQLGIYGNDSTVHTDTSIVLSVEEYDHREVDSPRAGLAPGEGLEIELQPHSVVMTGRSDSSLVANEN